MQQIHLSPESGSMDAEVKRVLFIGTSAVIRESFRFSSLVAILFAMKVYCSLFYGSMLWELGGREQTRSSTPGSEADLGCTQSQQVLLDPASSGLWVYISKGRYSDGKSPSYEVSVMAGLAKRDLH